MSDYHIHKVLFTSKGITCSCGSLMLFVSFSLVSTDPASLKLIKKKPSPLHPLLIFKCLDCDSSRHYTAIDHTVLEIPVDPKNIPLFPAD